MKRLLVALALMSVPAFGGDPFNLLPTNHLVTIHATLNAYDACFAVAKILGDKVKVFYAASLQTGPPFKLDLVNLTGAKAFDAITAQVNQRWEARIDFLHPGLVTVTISDPPAVQPGSAKRF